MVRDLVHDILDMAGYDVMTAATPADADRLCREYGGHIHLLLTDIVMPHTSGPQLVAKYLAERPAPIVIYMSGYADDALSRYELDPTTVFLRKPFTPSALARTIRDALDAAPATRTAGANSAAD